MNRISKAVIPVAGLGTRMLPASKAVSKCMFPLVDAPVIQYVVEEACAAGINSILLVVGANRDAIQNHFTRPKQSPESAAEERLNSLIDKVHIEFAVQPELNGLGGAVACAGAFVGKSAFAVLLGDTVTLADTPVIGQLAAVYAETGGVVLGIEQVADSLVHRYGIVDVDERQGMRYRIKDLIEKPDLARAPSRLAIAARYILPPQIFDVLQNTESGINNEIQLTDAIRELLGTHPVHALQFEGRRFDIGSTVDFVTANVRFALQREEFASQLTAQLKELNQHFN